MTKEQLEIEYRRILNVANEFDLKSWMRVLAYLNEDNRSLVLGLLVEKTIQFLNDK